MAWWVGLTLLVSTQSTGIELNLHDTWDRLLPVQECPNASTSRWSDARARAAANPNPSQGPGMGLGQPDWMMTVCYAECLCTLLSLSVVP